MGTQADIKEDLKKDLARTDEEPKPKTIREMLLDPAQQAEIARAIPTSMTPERFARLATTAINGSPQLQRCTAKSLIAACMQAAALGLEPNTPLGHCWLLPFENRRDHTFDVQFILGYRGIINLALRSPNIHSVQARAVYEKDEFEYELGLNEKLFHKPVFEEDSGPIVTYYGIVRYPDGGHYWTLVKPHTVEEHRNRSSSPNSPAWKNDYEAMALKTVIRIMSPYMPLSAEAAAGLAADGTAPVNYDDIVKPDEDIIDVESHEDTDAEDEPVRCTECGEVDGEHQDDCSKKPKK